MAEECGGAGGQAVGAGLKNDDEIADVVERVREHVRAMVDDWGVDRKRASLAGAALVFLAGIPASLSFGLLGDVTLFGRNVFELMDYTASNILLPVGGIGTALFAGWKVWPLMRGQLALPAGVAVAMQAMCRVVAPLLIGLILVWNL